MLRVITCVTQEHDLRLVLLAAVLCVATCVSAFNLIAHADGVGIKRDRWAWVAIAAVVSGCGIWATHFVAMLAYQPGVPLDYHIGLTGLSVVVAVIVVGLGYWVSLAGGVWVGIGGGLAGAGIGAMHYTGMAALRTPALIDYDAATVGVSMLLGVGLGAAAFALRQHLAGLPGVVAAGLLFAAAIVSMHFTGMAALTFNPASVMDFAPASTGWLSLGGGTMSSDWIAIAVSATAFLIVLLSFVAGLLDQQLALRQRDHLARLDLANAELEHTSASLRDAVEAADASNRAKSQFLATMSHELRTPLNAVIGFAELLEMGLHGPLGDPRYKGYAQAIRESGVHLLELINDILDSAKIEAGRLSLSDDQIDVAELITASLRLVAGAAADRGLQLRTNLEKNLPRLRADERRVKQVILNVLSNAIKFTPGSGTVTIAAESGARELVIRVTDTGIGIAPADLPKALEPFGQVENTLTRCQDGTGLGLPLSKQLMELHGGELSIISEPGRGTTVTLTFPPDRLIATAHEPAPPHTVLLLPQDGEGQHSFAA